MKMPIKLIAAVASGAIWLASGATWPARAQMIPGQPVVPLGYCQLTSIDASTLVSSCSGGIPVGANFAVVQPEAQAIRYRDDGTAPTSSVGMPLAVGASLYYAGALSSLRVISATSGAKLNVLFYRAP